MDRSVPRPDTINSLRLGAEAALAMLAGMQLEVFTPLQGGSMAAEQIANALGVGPARLRLLLYALVAAGLLTEQDGRFANTPEAHHFLVKDSPAYIGHMASLWALKLQGEDPQRTAASLRAGIPQAYLDFSQGSPEELEAFLRRISVSTVAAAHELVEQYDFSSTKTLADVGGGAGGMAITLTQACSHIQATVIDLPRVTTITQKIVKEAGATERVTVLAADVVSGPLPGAYDVAIVRELLQVLSADEARRAVHNIGAAIKPGGTIYVVGQILDDSRTSPLDAVVFNLSFLNAFHSGQSYTEREHRAWLSAAGLVDIERANFLLTDGLGSGVMTARKQG